MKLANDCPNGTLAQSALLQAKIGNLKSKMVYGRTHKPQTMSNAPQTTNQEARSW